MPETYTIEWARVADAQYDRILAEIWEFSPRYFLKLVRAVENSLVPLHEWPRFYPQSQYKPERQYRKIVVDGNYIILYRILEKRRVVRIEYIFHGAMDIASRIN